MFQDNQILIYDGAMGTMLQSRGLEQGQIPDTMSITNPQAVADVHRAYMDAGSNIICSNTFGSNAHNLKDTPYSPQDLITASIHLAKDVSGGDALVSLDIGPSGARMAPMGDVSFEAVYDLFKEMAICGEKAGADCATIETMFNLAEFRAAVLAVKENTSLPILATMTFEPDGKTFLGTTAESFAMTAEGLGVTALGVNCSTGPDALLETVKRIAKVTTLPLIVKPNAGLPDKETGKYNLKPDEFAALMEPFVKCGAGLVGGCCGTNPDYIAKLSQVMEGKKIQKNKGCDMAYACSAARFVALDDQVLLGTSLLEEPDFLTAVADCDGDTILDWIETDTEDGANLICFPIVDVQVENCVEILQHIQEFIYEPMVFVAKEPDSLGKMLREFQGKACVLADDSADLEALSVPILKYGAILMGH